VTILKLVDFESSHSFNRVVDTVPVLVVVDLLLLLLVVVVVVATAAVLTAQSRVLHNLKVHYTVPKRPPVGPISQTDESKPHPSILFLSDRF
jgi:hypothetical protein